MALILPLLLLLVLGILEFGRAWNIKHVITDATREAARRAVVQNPLIIPDSVTAAVTTALQRSNISTADATVTFDSFPPALGGHWRETSAMQTVDVGVGYRFRFFGPLFEALTGSETITIGSRVTMRNE
jgi:Flp pilus assembly protein TadG